MNSKLFDQIVLAELGRKPIIRVSIAASTSARRSESRDGTVVPDNLSDQGNIAILQQSRVDHAGEGSARFESGQIVTIRILPACDPPEGFQSQPGTTAPAFDEKAMSPKPLSKVGETQSRFTHFTVVSLA